MRAAKVDRLVLEEGEAEDLPPDMLPPPQPSEDADESEEMAETG